MTGATLIVQKGNQFALCKVRCDGQLLMEAIPKIDGRKVNTPALYCQAYLAYHLKDIVPTDAQFEQYDAAVEKYNEQVQAAPPAPELDSLEALMYLQDLQRSTGVVDAQGQMIAWLAQLELTRQGVPFEFEMDVPDGLTPHKIYLAAEEKADELMSGLGDKFEDYLCSYADYEVLLDLDTRKAYQFKR